MKVETFIDKSDWGDGPWQAEPDKMEWVDPDTMLDCLIVRNHGGALCGYVGVPRHHPLYGVTYHRCGLPPRKQPQYRRSGRIRGKDKQRPRHCSANRWSCMHTPEALFQVHGGLTFSGLCSGRVCHAPAPGRPKKVFWFGFDCAHYNDVSPGLNTQLRASYASWGKEYIDLFPEATYRRMETVIGYVQLLAQQLRNFAERTT